MKANEFIKKFGVVKANKLVIGYQNVVVYKFYNYDFEKEDGQHDRVCLADLKRLVKSHELVEKLGGVDEAKIYVPDGYKSERLKQAIADVESCQ